ncbi:MAG: hypothetical protein RMM17_07080 [Acidobacteriota bacterium]|nr:hypothetical protein [Blastocatellia bacterium]MDW8412427.1 hypothetical protein [Acidobacteriota bacterium]
MGFNIGNVANNVVNNVRNTLDQIGSLVRDVAQNVTIQSLSRLRDIADFASNLTGARIGSGLLAPRGGFPISPLGYSDKVVEAGVKLAKALFSKSPDAEYDGRIETYPKGQNLGSEPKVYIINGIQTDLAGREALAVETANKLGVNVNLIHNSTGGSGLIGAAKDLAECIGQLVLGIPSKPSQTLANEIFKNLTANPPKKMELIGYSQGSIMVAHAVSMAIERLKRAGYSDEQIRSLMSQSVKVKLVGTPIDISNPMHTILNVPGGKHLSWYFTMEDRLISGRGVPFNEVVNSEAGRRGELAEANFHTIRHEKDLVATVVRDLGIDDLARLASPATRGLYLAELGARIAYSLIGSAVEGGDPFAYHGYYNVYLPYMLSEGLLRAK